MKIKNYIFFLLICLSAFGFSQGKYVVNNKKGVDKINFKVLNNVIVIPVEVNGVELSFLLDSGVGNRPIVFNFLKESDSLEILNAETIYLKGLGDNGKIPALKSSGNTFKIGDAENTNQDFYVIFDSSINFAPKLGVPIHGIIGYDLFKDLVVNINYSRKHLRLYNPDIYKSKRCKNCETFWLEFYNNKPYINAIVTSNDNDVPIRLLVDSGSSDALWLFENDSLGLGAKSNYFQDFLGYGLSGNVHGKRSKVEALKLKSFTLKRPLVAYPDSTFINVLKKIKGRNGSIGGEIIKRFNVVMNYKKASMTLKRNNSFNKRFSYNKSGIELENEGVRLVTEQDRSTTLNNDSNKNNKVLNIQAVYVDTRKYVIKKAFTITSVRTNSPAARVGLQKGDLIIKINGNDTIKYTLQELIYKFYGDEGDRINLEIERLGRRFKVSFNLESLIK